MTIAVELFDDFEAVERDAMGALGRLARLSLFERLNWFRLIGAHCAPPGRLHVLRAQGRGSRAWLFLALDGQRARAYSSWYSLRYGPVTECLDRPTCHDLMVAIARTLKARGITEIDLHPLVEEQLLAPAFREAGWVGALHQTGASWRIATEGQSFEDYWEGRPARLRHTADRKSRPGRLEIEIRDTFDARAWADYEQVYQRSWKPAEGSPAFLRELAEQEGEAGTLRIGIARSGNEPVAAQLWLVENGIATIHKLAHVEAERSLSPGTVLMKEMFRHVLDEDKVKLVDFGLGDDLYKADWMDLKEPVYRFIAYNPWTAAGLFGIARQAAAKLVQGQRSD